MFMGEITKVTEMDSEDGFCIDTGPFFLNEATAGHETESEVGLYNNITNRGPLSRDLAH